MVWGLLPSCCPKSADLTAGLLASLWPVCIPDKFQVKILTLTPVVGVGKVGVGTVGY